MNCPRCHMPLTEETYLGYKLNACTMCHGKLLPQANLIGFIKQLENEEIEPKLADDKIPVPAQHAALSCPKCSAIMSNHGYMGVESIMIDTCADCGLVWTDSDELQRMSVLNNDHEEKSKARRINERKNSDTLSTVLESRGNESALFASVFSPVTVYLDQALKEQRARRIRENPKQTMPTSELIGIIVLTLVVFAYSTYGLITGEFWQPSIEEFGDSGTIYLEGTRRYFGFATEIFILLSIVTLTVNHYSNKAGNRYRLLAMIFLGLGFIMQLFAMFWPIT